jgi:hypothetical protein
LPLTIRRWKQAPEVSLPVVFVLRAGYAEFAGGFMLYFKQNFKLGTSWKNY